MSIIGLTSGIMLRSQCHPCHFKYQKTKSYHWKKWQDNPVPEDQYNKWKREGLYKQGVAVITGKIWRGPSKGKYLACIDCDNQRGIDELLSNCFPDIKTLEELSQRTIVEQHLDNRKKAHIYLILEGPLKNRPGLKSEEKDKEGGIPIIEVKSEGKSYMICSPSVHKDGHRYENHRSQRANGIGPEGNRSLAGEIKPSP